MRPSRFTAKKKPLRAWKCKEEFKSETVSVSDARREDTGMCVSIYLQQHGPQCLLLHQALATGGDVALLHLIIWRQERCFLCNVTF